MREGTVSPRPFQSFACRSCQAGGFSVPCSARGALPCQLLQRWGSQVLVGRGRKGSRADGRSTMVDDECVGELHVPIDRGTVAGNPFVGGPLDRLTQAYDELLHVLLSEDLNYDELALQFPQLVDEPSFGVTGAEPMERRLLLEIATTHGVLLQETFASRFRIQAFRVWIAFYAQRLRLGCSLKLLCHCIEGPSPPWSCHGQGIAGALTWVAGLSCWPNHTVRLLLMPFPSLWLAWHAHLSSCAAPCYPLLCLKRTTPPFMLYWPSCPTVSHSLRGHPSWVWVPAHAQYLLSLVESHTSHSSGGRSRFLPNERPPGYLP